MTFWTPRGRRITPPSATAISAGGRCAPSPGPPAACLGRRSPARQGFLCVFSLTDRESFEELREFRDQVGVAVGGRGGSRALAQRRAAQILRVHEDTGRAVVLLLVGNKADLEAERVVSRADAEALAREWGVGYYEASAKTGLMVDEVFTTMLGGIVAAKGAAGVGRKKNRGGKKRKRKKGGCSVM